MTTPQQPDDDLKVKAEVIEDLEAPDDDGDNIAGGCIGGVGIAASRIALPELPKLLKQE